MTVACGSQTNLYVPFFSVTVHCVVPVEPTPVFLFTPGPVRWKLWMPDLSATVIVYLPALSVVTFFEPFLRLMLKAGPTTADSFTGAADAVAAITSDAIRAAS